MVGRPARGSCSFSALQGPRETSPPRLGGRDATRLAQAPLRGGRGVLWSLNRTREGIWRAPSPRGKGCSRGSPQKLRERCPQARAGTPWRQRMGGPRVVGVEGGWGPRETRKWTASPRTAKGAAKGTAKLWPPVCPVWLGLLDGPGLVVGSDSAQRPGRGRRARLVSPGAAGARPGQRQDTGLLGRVPELGGSRPPALAPNSLAVSGRPRGPVETGTPRPRGP